MQQIVTAIGAVEETPLTLAVHLMDVPRCLKLCLLPIFLLRNLIRWNVDHRFGSMLGRTNSNRTLLTYLWHLQLCLLPIFLLRNLIRMNVDHRFGSMLVRNNSNSHRCCRRDAVNTCSSIVVVEMMGQVKSLFHAMQMLAIPTCLCCRFSSSANSSRFHLVSDLRWGVAVCLPVLLSAWLFSKVR